MALIVPAMFGVGYAPETGQLWVAVAFLILFGLGWGFFDANNMPILCQIVRPSLRATGYGIMNLVSISCGGFADWGFGLLRDRHVPLFGIFGVFASAAVLSVVLVLLIRPRDTETRMTPIRPLHEFVAATHSPFHADGSLAPEVVADAGRLPRRERHPHRVHHRVDRRVPLADLRGAAGALRRLGVGRRRRTASR